MPPSPVTHPRALFSLLALGLALLGSGFGCDTATGVRWIDPPIVLADSSTGPTNVPPEVSLGFYDDAGQYSEVVEGGSLWIVWGTQGGNWSMPTIRTRGIGSLATVACKLVTDAGEALPGAVTRTKFFPTPDGSLEVPNFPLPIFHAAPREGDPIDDLYGQGATLDCTVDDGDGHVGRKTLGVALAKG